MESLVNRLAATCVVELPEAAETRLVRTARGVDCVRGRFGFRFRDVFEDYYKPSSEKGIETAPYLLFARCTSDPDSIIRFTNAWGHLHHPASQESMSGFDPSIFSEQELKERHKYFFFTPFWWRKVQQQFKNVMERVAQPEWEPWQNGIREHLPMFPSTIRFQIVRLKDALAPQATTESLIEAFWLMLWLDTSLGEKRVRICANEKCTIRLFRADRSDQVYCCERCRDCTRKRRYWLASGSENRRQSRKKRATTSKRPARARRKINL